MRLAEMEAPASQSLSAVIGGTGAIHPVVRGPDIPVAAVVYELVADRFCETGHHLRGSSLMSHLSQH